MSIAECAALVERGDPDRFLATMSAPVAARAVLFPLYAFNVEVTRAPWASEEPMICEMRLQWWRDILGEIGAGAPARAHEVAAPLSELLGGHAEVLPVLDALVEARRWDVYRDPFADRPAFDAYIEATSAGLMWAAARCLGTPEAAEPAVRNVGWASGLAALFRAVPELEARGRKPLFDGRTEAVAALAGEGLARLGAARRAGLPPEARAAARAAWRSGATLSRAKAAPERVGQGALAESGFARSFSLMHRVLRGSW